MQLEHKTPPYGLSGLFFVFGRFFLFEETSLGTAFNKPPQLLHVALECFLALKLRIVLLPGVLLKTLLNVLDLCFGSILSFGILASLNSFA